MISGRGEEIFLNLDSCPTHFTLNKDNVWDWWKCAPDNVVNISIAVSLYILSTQVTCVGWPTLGPMQPQSLLM